MTRLGFFIHFNRTWMGGINVILNLINLIYEDKDYKAKPRIQIIIFTNSKKKLSKYSINQKVDIIENKQIFDQNLLKKIIDKFSLICFGKTIFFENFLLKYKLNYISHSNFITGNKSNTKSIAWIPDFQYIYYPEFFSLRYKVLKYLNIKLFSKFAYKILLSSKSSKRDLMKFYNVTNRNLLVNSFYFKVPKKNSLNKFSYLEKKYKLPRNYFYLPNQFWMHKNHKIVIEALRKIKKENKNNKIVICTTGSKYDHRNPKYFSNLMNMIKSYNLEPNFIYLGVVPYLDVMSLIYNSCAVINPSFFEGWSSTVQQADAYNKILIISKIDVHIEQNPSKVIFFNPNNADSLKKILINFNQIKKNTSKKNKKNSLKIEIDKYIRDYLKIIN